VAIPSSSLRATKGSVAISSFSMRCEIASVVLLPRNDVTTQSPRGEGEHEDYFRNNVNNNVRMMLMIMEVAIGR
jgi:hypothetical protein